MMEDFFNSHDYFLLYSPILSFFLNSIYRLIFIWFLLHFLLNFWKRRVIIMLLLVVWTLGFVSNWHFGGNKGSREVFVCVCVFQRESFFHIFPSKIVLFWIFFPHFSLSLSLWFLLVNNPPNKFCGPFFRKKKFRAIISCVKKLKRERDIKPVRDNLHISSRPCIYAIYRYICVIASFSFELFPWGKNQRHQILSL